VTFVTQQFINVNSGTSATLQIANPWTPGAGNHLYVVAAQESTGTVGVADGINTYTLLGTFEDTNVPLYYAVYEVNNVAGSSIQPTATGAGGANKYPRLLYIREDSGLARPAYIAGTLTTALATAPGTGSNAITTGGISVGTVPAELIGVCVSNGGTAQVAGTGFTGRGAVGTAAPARATLSEDQGVFSVSSPAVTYTAGLGAGSNDYIVIGAAFQLSAPMGGVTAPGPGISPSQQMQFRGLLPLSSYIQNTVVALTGTSIASSQGSLSLGFGGQSIFSTQGTLTPSISAALTTFVALATDQLISSSTESITTYSTNWSLAEGAYNVTTLGGVGNATDSAAFWNAAIFPNNQFSQATLHSVGMTTGGNGVAVRCTANSGGNYYSVRVNGGSPTSYNVLKIVNGIGTSLTGGNVTNVFSVGDVILLTIVGSTLSAYQNTTLLFTTTDSSLTAGSPGVAATGTTGPAVTSWSGGGITSISAFTGTLAPFGISSPNSPGALWNAGPGVGPFANWQFSPRPLGFTNQNSVPLTGSSIISSTGAIGPTLSVSLITAGGEWIGALLIQGLWTNTAGTPGGWTSSVYTSTQIVSSTGTVSPIIGGLVALVGQSLGSAQGTLSQAGSVTVPLIGSLMLSNTGNLTYIIPPGPEGELFATIQALIEAGLIPQLYYSESQTVAAGFVISLTPPVGTLVEPNTAVVVVASTGPGAVPQGGTTVPNLVGLYWYDATTALAAAFLSIDKYIWQVNSAENGTVIAQSIAAGTAVPVATIIKLTLSSGPVTVIPPIPVP
jgi:PASTA domain